MTELRKAKLPVGLYLALQNATQELQADNGNAAAADVWQIVMRIEEGAYADIAANWRAARDALLENLNQWQISEAILQRQVNAAADAWQAYAPARGYDATTFDPVWQNISLQISGGNRTIAAQMIRQFDSEPGELLHEKTFYAVNPNEIEALREIRMRLMDPQLNADQRKYFEQLLPGLE